MLAASKSKYEEFKIVTENGVFDLYNTPQMRVIQFDYFENIFSGHITGSIVISSGLGVGASSDDPQPRGQMFSNLLRQGSFVLAKIKPTLGPTLDFSSNKYKFLYVKSIQRKLEDSTSETITLQVESLLGLKNDIQRDGKHYNGNIGDSAIKILTEELEFPESMIEIDKPVNSWSFYGVNKKPLDILLMMAKQSIPSNTNNPGYFFFEVKDGFRYVSVDAIINSKTYERQTHRYKFNGVNKSSFDEGGEENDFKILSLTDKSIQSINDLINIGAYQTKTIFFDPTDYVFTEIDISVVGDGKLSSLGKKQKIPRVVSEEFKNGKFIGRVQSAILDTADDKKGRDVNNSPELYTAATSVRYNILRSQQYKVSVPCNTNLKAGDTIHIEFESKSDNKIQGPDQTRSGTYIIEALCHHFEPNKSITSMTLMRDSYGLHFTRGK